MKLRAKFPFSLGFQKVPVIRAGTDEEVGELVQRHTGYGQSFKGRVVGYVFVPNIDGALSGLQVVSASTKREALELAGCMK